MKKTNFLICVLFTILSFNLNIFAYSGGNGTLTDPYQISNTDDLIQLMNDSANLGRVFIITNDIDCQNLKNAKPIGYRINEFSGRIDGNSFNISNLTIDLPNEDAVGFIGSNRGRISNIRLINCNITGKNYVGGISGIAYRSLTNCFSSGNITGKGNYVGGIAGLATLDSANYTKSDANVKGIDFVGGIFGALEDYYFEYPLKSVFKSFNSKGTVEGRNFVGGLIGGIYNCKMENCFSQSDVIASGSNVGGFCGSNIKGNLNNCNYSGKVQGIDFVGGFCGSNNSIIINCNVDSCNVSGKINTGGFCGSNSNGFISKSTTGNATKVNGFNNAGGFCGLNKAYISLCSSKSVIQSDGDNSGGFCGLNQYMINHSYSIGSISGQEFCGGFCGKNENGIINSSYSTASISSTANSIGGFCGDNEKGYIHYCYWDKEVTGMLISSGGDGRNTSEMKSSANYHNWNLEVIWSVIDDSYPDFAKPHSYSGGIGFEQEPFKISNTNDFEYLMNNIENWGSHFILTDNLDCNDISVPLPIGNSNVAIFSGKFNGKKKTISNLKMNYPAINNIGLFGFNYGNIWDLNLINCSITGNDYSGGFCGQNLGSIKTCSVININVAGNSNVGGFCGSNNLADNLGYFINAVISECFSTGNVKSTGINSGGFIGSLYGSSKDHPTVKNCYSESNIISQGDNTGGFCGLISGTYNFNGVINCYSTGKVTGNSNGTGGFYGNKTNSVTNCYWDIEKSGIDSGLGGQGKTTQEMFIQSTFQKWNFDTIWYMPPNDYPKLQPFKTVSVDDNNVDFSSGFMVFPNPASDFIEINVNNRELKPFVASANIQIFDIIGIEVMSEEIHPMTGSHRMNVSGLPQGVYYIKIGNRTAKFVKM